VDQVVIVRRPPTRAPRNRVSWLVGFLATTESVLQAGDAAIDGRGIKVFWWLAGALVMLVFAMRLEAFKARGGR